MHDCSFEGCRPVGVWSVSLPVRRNGRPRNGNAHNNGQTQKRAQHTNSNCNAQTHQPTGQPAKHDQQQLQHSRPPNSHTNKQSDRKPTKPTDRTPAKMPQPTGQKYRLKCAKATRPATRRQPTNRSTSSSHAHKHKMTNRASNEPNIGTSNITTNKFITNKCNGQPTN